MKYKKIKRFLCHLFGHKPVYVLTYRRRADGTKCRKHSYEGTMCCNSGKRRGRRHLVQVAYYECIRCGKHLTQAQNYKSY